MERIRPFWRIVLGFVIFCFCVSGTSNLFMGGSYGSFAFWWAFFVAYIFLCVKIKYDDPLRSMRDLLAEQAESGHKRNEDPPDTDRIAALEAELAKLREQIQSDKDP